MGAKTGRYTKCKTHSVESSRARASFFNKRITRLSERDLAVLKSPRLVTSCYLSIHLTLSLSLLVEKAQHTPRKSERVSRPLIFKAACPGPDKTHAHLTPVVVLRALKVAPGLKYERTRARKRDGSREIRRGRIWLSALPAGPGLIGLRMPAMSPRAYSRLLIFL